jgi:uncharacterized membrane protein YcaP (DUF421 family)
MNLVLRAACVYLFLLAVMRLAGRRTISNSSTFDLVLLLVISEAVGGALFSEQDHSLTSAAIVVVTMVGLDIAFSVLKVRSAKFSRLVDGLPLVLVADGKALDERMRKARVSAEDLATAARENGFAGIEDLRYVVLETNGKLSVIPKPKEHKNADESLTRPL